MCPGLPAMSGTKCAISREAVGDLCASGGSGDSLPAQVSMARTRIDWCIRSAGAP